jgi:uncharacterized membrane protein (UPF0127 family)
MRLKIGENIFHVKVVTSKFEKAQGMMNRRFTDEFNGMLFLMDEDENCFWMKKCIIPLDIIFIEGTTISKIFHDCPPSKEENCKNYCGEGRLILEIQGGSAKELEIKKGDEVKLLL